MDGSGHRTTVTREAIKALGNMRNNLEELHQDLHKEIEKLNDAFDENRDGLGAHADDIKELLESLGVEVGDAKKLVKKLQMRLLNAELHRESLIEDSPYKGPNR